MKRNSSPGVNLQHALRIDLSQPRRYDALIESVQDHTFVLIGEASHGTHEFYAERDRITQRLIEEKGFNAIAVEADWPDGGLS